MLYGNARLHVVPQNYKENLDSYHCHHLPSSMEQILRLYNLFEFFLSSTCKHIYPSTPLPQLESVLHHEDLQLRKYDFQYCTRAIDLQMCYIIYTRLKFPQFSPHGWSNTWRVWILQILFCGKHSSPPDKAKGKY